MTEEVQLYFVLPKDADSEDDCDAEMQQAFNQCEQHRSSGIAAEWITEDQCAAKVNLTKRDVFVLQEFKGKLFNKLHKTKAVIVGARCLSCCLTEGSQIPPGPQPVYTVAMRGLIITASGLDKEQKEKLKTKILWMGGRYDNMMTVQTTHVISNTIFSDKYNNAVATNIPVMHLDWVEAVWEDSLVQNVSGADPRFLQQHRLPTFFGAVMTTSGFSKHEKKKIVSLINDNGGKFKGDFESATTDVVVMNSDSVGGGKHKAAIEYNKYCVLPTWIYESVAKGCALHPDKFKVYGNKTSSPFKDGVLPDMSLNLSTITNLRNPVMSSVDETCSTTVSSDSTRLTNKDITNRDSTKGRTPRACPPAKDPGSLIDGIEMKDAKAAGPFLDGCCIYVYGTSTARRDKAHRLVSRCGGVRYDSPGPSVTHALGGEGGGAGPPSPDRAAMPRAAVLSLKWLADSIRAGRQLEESQYLVSGGSDKSSKETAQASASPMSKRNLQLLQTRPPVPLFNLEPENEMEKDDIMQQYLSQSKQPVGDSEDALAEYFKQGGGSFKAPNSTSSNVNEASANNENTTITTVRVKMGEDKDVTTEDKRANNAEMSKHENDACTMTEMTEDDLSEIFNDITFELQGMEEVTACEVAVNIEASGGTVVGVGKGGRYVVVPLDYDEEEVVNKKAIVVTTFWLDDCLSQEEIVPISYYHRPVKVAGAMAPLTEQILGISTYMGVERTFIDELAQLLGATTQLTFCRRNTETTRASTHLICPEAKGDKYKGALKWGLPAVTSQWLLACATQGRRVKEGPFLIGDTKEPVWKLEDISVIKPETSVAENENTYLQDNNKENLSRDKTIPASTVPANKSADDDDDGDEPPDDNHLTRAEDILMRERLSDTAEENGDKSDRTIVCDIVNGLPFKANTASDNTPKAKGIMSLGGSTEMSPASRFIALNRQGLLGSDSQETPKRVSELCKDFKLNNESVSTPPMDNALSTPNLALFSPTSRRRLQAIKRGEMPSDPIKTPRNPFQIEMATPESPFGRLLRPNTGHMSAESKKKLWQFCEQLPAPSAKNGPKDTPISELSRRFFSRYNENDSTPQARRQLQPSDSEDTPPLKQRKLNEEQTPSTPEQSSSVKSALQMDVQNSLTRLTSIMARKSSAGRTPQSSLARNLNTPSPAEESPKSHVDAAVAPSSCSDSQAYTVGWDDTTHTAANLPTTKADQPKVYKFILSQNVNNRADLVSIINRLGGTVTEGTELDLSVSHMLYSKPAKSEKIMASIAAGIWLLHPSYIPRCGEAGKFIDEEPFEWGNPSGNLPPLEGPTEEQVALAGRRWRKARSQGSSAPFQGLRVLLHVLPARRPPLLRLIVTGGGTVADVSPPYTKEVNATHCIAELQRMALSDDDQEYLISRKIPLCPPTFISRLLIEEPLDNPMLYAYPAYRKLMLERYGDS